VVLRDIEKALLWHYHFILFFSDIEMKHIGSHFLFSLVFSFRLCKIGEGRRGSNAFIDAHRYAAARCYLTSLLIYLYFSFLDSGQLFSAGGCEFGQLGDGVMEARARDMPQRIESLFGKKVVDIACGFDHSICLTGMSSSFSFHFNRFAHFIFNRFFRS